MRNSSDLLYLARDCCISRTFIQQAELDQKHYAKYLDAGKAKRPCKHAKGTSHMVFFKGLGTNVGIPLLHLRKSKRISVFGYCDPDTRNIPRLEKSVKKTQVAR